MTHDEVTLTRPQADALEAIRAIRDDDTIVEVRADASDSFVGLYAPLNDVSLDTLIRALYIGYDVEKTPDERIKERYDILASEKLMASAIRCDEIVRTLDMLGHKIEGVNA